MTEYDKNIVRIVVAGLLLAGDMASGSDGVLEEDNLSWAIREADKLIAAVAAATP